MTAQQQEQEPDWVILRRMGPGNDKNREDFSVRDPSSNYRMVEPNTRCEVVLKFGRLVHSEIRNSGPHAGAQDLLVIHKAHRRPLGPAPPIKTSLFPNMSQLHEDR